MGKIKAGLPMLGLAGLLVETGSCPALGPQPNLFIHLLVCTG